MVLTESGVKESATRLKPWQPENTRHLMSVWAVDNECDSMDITKIKENMAEAGGGFALKGKIWCGQHLYRQNYYTKERKQSATKRLLFMDQDGKCTVKSVAMADKDDGVKDFVCWDNVMTTLDKKDQTKFVAAAKEAKYLPGECYIVKLNYRVVGTDYFRATPSVSGGRSPICGWHNCWTEDGYSGYPLWMSMAPSNPNDNELGIIGMHSEGGHKNNVIEKVAYPNKYVPIDKLLNE